MDILINYVFEKISPWYMNKRSVYDETYFADNHKRHLYSWYSVVTKLYYQYVAQYAMVTPSGIQKGDRVLDVGCGVGILTERLHHLGFESVGVDVNEPAIASSVYPQGCSLVETTAQLEYPENFFDLIVSREVLEHIPNSKIDECIKEWDRVGKGRMVHLIAVKEHGACALNDPTHVNVESEQWWVEKFQAHGYNVTRRPRKWFFSPFGSTGYLMMTKK